MNDTPIIITDSREQTPLIFEHLQTERGTLQSGDYSIQGLEHDFSIERKSISDLCQSVTRGRERFERRIRSSLCRSVHLGAIARASRPPSRTLDVVFLEGADCHRTEDRTLPYTRRNRFRTRCRNL
jgi:hypothetical protein